MATQNIIENTFDPTDYSTEELAWILENLDKPAAVALRVLPDKINPNAVRPLLMRVQELNELQAHENIQWVGVDVIKQSIKTYLTEDARWEAEHKRNPRVIPRFPSLYSWDAKGRPHLGGIGSDSGRVRTYFLRDANGKTTSQRAPFAVSLLPEQIIEWTPPSESTEVTYGTLLVDDADMLRWECRVPTGHGEICGHTESYKRESRSSRAAARARMSKHLRRATENSEGHREVHTNEFGA